jgi:hypothetical protein
MGDEAGDAAAAGGAFGPAGGVGAFAAGGGEGSAANATGLALISRATVKTADKRRVMVIFRARKTVFNDTHDRPEGRAHATG